MGNEPTEFPKTESKEEGLLALSYNLRKVAVGYINSAREYTALGDYKQEQSLLDKAKDILKTEKKREKEIDSMLEEKLKNLEKLIKERK